MTRQIRTVSALLAGVVMASASPAHGQQGNRHEGQQHNERMAQIRRAQEAEILRREIRVYDVSDLYESSERNPAERQFSRLMSVIEMDFAAVTPSTFAVRAIPEEHTRLLTLLDSVRAEQDKTLDEEAETFVIRLMMMAADAGVNPVVGRPILMDRDDVEVELLTMPQITLAQGSPGMVQVGQSETFIAGYQPVVSASAVGYQPNVETYDSGMLLEASIEVVGNDRASIDVSAEISTLEIVEQTLRLGDAMLPIGLPKTDSRSIEGRVTLPFGGAPIVVSVVQGFEGESDLLVLAATIQPVGMPDEPRRQAR